MPPTPRARSPHTRGPDLPPSPTTGTVLSGIWKLRSSHHPTPPNTAFVSPLLYALPYRAHNTDRPGHRPAESVISMHVFGLRITPLHLQQEAWSHHISFARPPSSMSIDLSRSLFLAPAFADKLPDYSPPLSRPAYLTPAAHGCSAFTSFSSRVLPHRCRLCLAYKSIMSAYKLSSTLNDPSIACASDNNPSSFI
ncbi:hypothetical protein RhiXN_01479 [Rhizoctonia solani]|uniref:Uncharacterized protein n=1 Tax=Rhizoctonia solani TaxID=456999 RepID=A0A8H8P7C7_9AGAM|nr:uncharacterized protein RhiXN_01479 [Rhizoctonia solani]QRW26884.1 hypothetical protein RhiXN_01479 [Rhizoctonia solani]